MGKNIRREDWKSLQPTSQGWGIVDVNYVVQIKKTIGYVDGKQQQVTYWICPYYEDWSGMIERCFCPKFKEKQPTYEGVSICKEWQYLSNFIEWVDSQPNRDWENCSLDKDFFSTGVKNYSPETAIYIPLGLNGFITDTVKCRGGLMIGVTSCKDSKKNPFRSQCNNYFLGKQEYLGLHPTELAAHKAWQVRKHEHACALADLQQDERVAKRLREMYAPDKDWTNK